MSAPPPHKIVIIDDERPVLLTLEALLKRHGYEPHARELRQRPALALVRKEKPDIVLLDLGLPDADGLDVLRELKAEMPHLPVIILTANDSLRMRSSRSSSAPFTSSAKPYAP